MPNTSDTPDGDAPSRVALRLPGIISTLEIYTVEEAKARLRWTDSSLRAAKRRGLRLLSCGKRRYLSGDEIRRYLESI